MTEEEHLKDIIRQRGDLYVLEILREELKLYTEKSVEIIAKDFADIQSSSLQSQLEEKEKEAEELKKTIELMRTDAPEVWYRMEEQVKRIREQSSLIESIAGKVNEIKALDVNTNLDSPEDFIAKIFDGIDEALTLYNNYKNKQDGKIES